MEIIDRIERKSRKIVKWCHEMSEDVKENHEQYIFQDSHALVFDHIWSLAETINELRVDYAHGVNITQGIRKLKRDFNLIFNLYDDLTHLNQDPYRPRLAGRRRPLRPLH